MKRKNSISKKALAVFLSLLMVFSTVPMALFSAEAADGGSTISTYTEPFYETSHEWDEGVVTAPTCTEDGYTTYKCVNCGATEVRDEVPANGHNWSNWDIIKYPKDATPGSQERVCLDCLEVETMVITSDGFFTVNFYNYDKSRLIAPSYAAKGTAAVRPKDIPTKAEDVGYTYTFIGWDVSEDALNYVNGNIAAVAQYAASEKVYRVTFKNYSGAEIYTANVPYSQITYYKTPTTPTRPSDKTYNYKFVSWSVTYDMRTQTAVATPNFTSSVIPGHEPGNQKPKDGIFTWLIEWIKNFFKNLFGF